MGQRRPYAKLLNSVLGEPWDDATLADMVRLMLFLNIRWARDRLTGSEAGTAFLSPQEMMQVTQTRSVSRARARLLALADRTGGVSLAVREARVGRSPGVIVEWPKFPIEQGYPESALPKSGPNRAPPQTQTQTQTQKQTSSTLLRGQGPAGASDWARSMSSLFRELLRELRGVAEPSPSAFGAWHRVFDALRKDIASSMSNGRAPEQRIEAAIRYALDPKHQDDRFFPVIRCPRTLREKWNQLVEARKREQMPTEEERERQAFRRKLEETLQ